MTACKAFWNLESLCTCSEMILSDSRQATRYSFILSSGAYAITVFNVVIPIVAASEPLNELDNRHHVWNENESVSRAIFSEIFWSRIRPLNPLWNGTHCYHVRTDDGGKHKERQKKKIQRKLHMRMRGTAQPVISATKTIESLPKHEADWCESKRDREQIK